MKFSREQYLNYMLFKNVEQPIFVDLFGPPIKLKQEWAVQGARLQRSWVKIKHVFEFDDARIDADQIHQAKNLQSEALCLMA